MNEREEIAKLIKHYGIGDEGNYATEFQHPVVRDVVDYLFRLVKEYHEHGSDSDIGLYKHEKIKGILHYLKEIDEELKNAKK